MLDSQEKKTSVDELFHVLMIDRQRKLKISIKLINPKTGEEVPLKETVQKITENVSDHLKADTDDDQIRDFVTPLMAQSMVCGMSNLLGESLTSIILSQDYLRFGLVHMMTVSFCLLKFIQKEGIKIKSFSEPISQEDIDTYDRVGSASNAVVTAASLGADPKEIIREMLKQGLIKQTDLELLGAQDIDTKKERN